MKIKIQAAKVGQTIIDGCGYIYTVESVHGKYVAIGNGEFIMHQDYEVVEDSKVSDINSLSNAISDFYSENGHGFSDDILNKVLTRMAYVYEEKTSPKHAYTFEDFEEMESDKNYKYEFQEDPEKVS